MLVEHPFKCPYCDAPISVVVDLSSGDQTYIEDCEVCCQPIEIDFSVDDRELTRFDARRGDD